MRVDDEVMKFDGGGGGFDGEARLSLAVKRESTTVGSAVKYEGEERTMNVYW